MTENITNPTRTVDDILEALFPRCTDSLEGFKFLAPDICDCAWDAELDKPRTLKCESPWCWSVVHVPLSASKERLRRERIDKALRIANEPETALILELALKDEHRLSLTHLILGNFAKTCKAARRNPKSEESLLWFLGMFTHTPGVFLVPPFV